MSRAPPDLDGQLGDLSTLPSNFAGPSSATWPVNSSRCTGPYQSEIPRGPVFERAGCDQVAGLGNLAHRIRRDGIGLVRA